MSCIWTKETQVGVVWVTECGKTHAFALGGPYENGHYYCPYCGKAIKIFEEENDGRQENDM